MFVHTHVSALEEPLRFSSDDYDLYGVFHGSPQTSSRCALICSADGEERAWSLRTQVHLARALAERGVLVLRFDYAGQGESSGAFEATTVESRLRDIARALDLLQSRCPRASCAIVGFRLGATLALEAAAQSPLVRGLVLWEPILDLEGYVRNLVRTNLATQMVIHKRIVKTTEQLVAEMANGATVSANGYNLTKGFLDGLETLQPAAQLSRVGTPALVLTNGTTRVPECSAEIQRQSYLPFWKEPKADMTPPMTAIKETANWVNRHLPAGEPW